MAAAALAANIPEEEETDCSEDDDANYGSCCDGGVASVDGALLGLHERLGVRD